MAITILDYVKSVIGDKDSYTAEDCLTAGVNVIGGCQGCEATLAVYNAYPSVTGYWRCAICIGDLGFATVAEFTAHEAAVVDCPACGSADMISETRATTGERTEEYVLQCGDCGAVWQP